MGINTLKELEKEHDSYGNEIDLIDICIYAQIDQAIFDKE